MAGAPPLTDRQIAQVRRIFDKFDYNGDGTISQKELAYAISNVKYRTKDAALLMAQADVNSDKSITFEEFLDAVTYKTNQNGASTAEFNGLVRLVANYCVACNDKKSLTNLEQYKFWPPPVFLLIMSIVQISVFAYYADQDCDNVNLECPLSFSSSLAFRPGCREEAWRFLTYILVHAGWGHLLFNLLIQLVIGIPLEMVHGMWRVAILYVIGGLAGALGSSVFDPEANVVGASGAVYALIGAHVANVIENFHEMPFKWIRLTLLVVLIALDFSLSIYQRYFNDDTSNISYTGHLSGGMMGLTLGTFVLKNLKEEWYEVYIRYTGLALAVGGSFFAIFWNIFYDYKLKSCP